MEILLKVLSHLAPAVYAVSYFAITFSIRTSKRNTLIANKIKLNRNE